MMKQTFIFLACLVTLASCVGPTPYQKKGYNGGYVEKALEGDQFVFVFGANVYAEQQVASNGALRRAAEKTLELGYADFAVLKKSLFGFGRVMPDGARCHTSEIVARIPAAKGDPRIFRAAEVVGAVTSQQDVAATIPNTQTGPTVPMPELYKSHAISPPAASGVNSAMWKTHVGMLKQQIGVVGQFGQLGQVGQVIQALQKPSTLPAAAAQGNGETGR